jgi:OOP family OmpA-OmpF porin
MFTKKSSILTAALMGILILTLVSGCATKKYVKQQIDPISGKVDELTQMTKKNEGAIKDVDARAQAGIQTLQTKTNEVDQKAANAGQKADQAQQSAQNAQVQITNVETNFNQKFANIDNYKTVDKITVNFDFNKSKLTDAAKATLDQLAAKVKDTKGYVLEVQGFTDSKGSEGYNLGLSQKRSESVVRYFSAQHQIPVFRMAVVGQGAAKEVESNKTKEGRAANRRVEVTLLRAELK